MEVAPDEVCDGLRVSRGAFQNSHEVVWVSQSRCMRRKEMSCMVNGQRIALVFAINKSLLCIIHEDVQLKA